MRLIVLALTLLVFPAISSAAKYQVPANVTVRAADSRNSYIDTIDFSFESGQPPLFSKLKLCVAESITNNAVILQDAAGSFVGPATGAYYHNKNSQTVQGGGIFKFIDDANSVLIASGTTDGGSTALGLTRNILKFDLKAAIGDGTVTLKLSNITRAQQYTGNAANDGFQPVGTWRGASPQKVYDALELVATRIKACAVVPN